MKRLSRRTKPFIESVIREMTRLGAEVAGVRPRFVSLDEPGFALDPGKLRRAFNAKTRLILLNTPGNPSGRVLAREELSEISALCQKHGVVAVVDEIYEHLWYDGHRHVS